MGKTYLFECAKCGYRTAVVGGVEEGSDVRVQTAYCRDCRVLVDCVISLRMNKPGLRQGLTGLLASNESLKPPSVAAALNRLPSRPGQRRVWLKFKLACPVDPTHRVGPWKQPGRCPRCRTYMEPNALPFRVWD